jgi:hypothetical protein
VRGSERQQIVQGEKVMVARSQCASTDILRECNNAVIVGKDAVVLEPERRAPSPASGADCDRQAGVGQPHDRCQ